MVLRKRESKTLVDGMTVPTDLLDRDSATWVTVAATRRWLAAQNLPVSPEIEFGPIHRFKSSAKAWARANGLTRTWGAGDYLHIDFARVSALGIPMFTSAREQEERMLAQGVRIEN